MGDEKKVEVFETAEEVVQDPWALVEPTKKGKDWSCKNIYYFVVDNDDVGMLK